MNFFFSFSFCFFSLRAPDVHVHLNTVKHKTLEARDAVMDKKSLTGDVVVPLREYFLFGSWGRGGGGEEWEAGQPL